MFAFPADPPVATGSVSNQQKQPIPFKEVTPAVGAHKFATFNDAGANIAFMVHRQAQAQ
jgi:hypothetical protein